jgi:hypothetical protein
MNTPSEGTIPKGLPSNGSMILVTERVRRTDIITEKSGLADGEKNSIGG